MAKKKIKGEDGKEYTVKEKKPFYKRWWFIALMVIIVAGLVFGEDDEGDAGPQKVDDNTEVVEDEETTEEVDEEEVIENTEFGVDEKVEFDGQIVEVTDVEYSNGTEFDRPKEGKEYVIVHVAIENQSDDEITYNPFDFSMENSNGQVETQGLTIVDSDTALSSGTLREGGNVSGTVAFEQPIDDGGLKLIFKPSFWSADEVIFNLQ